MDIIVEKFAKQLRLKLKNKLKKLILFGSHARKDFNEGSDYDFAVIVGNRTKRIDEIVDKVSGELLTEYSKLIGPVIWDETEWELRKKLPIGINILKDGIEI